jgi:hypothetical protein
MKICSALSIVAFQFCFTHKIIFAAPADSMKIQITSYKILDNIPSCSGVEFYNSSIYICGDNSPYLFRLSSDGDLLEKFKIKNGDFKDTIPKKIKPDFESITRYTFQKQNQFLIFGSGSLSPYRDSLVQLNADAPEDYKTFSLSGLYQLIREKISGELNLEGACIYENILYLLNRSDNTIIKIAVQPLLHALNHKDQIPPIELIQIQLPAINNIQSSFSGAAIIPGTSKMIFTATTEDTPNAYDDGVNYGSYIGITDLQDLQKQPMCVAISDNKTTRPWKVESLAVVKVRKNKIELVLVTDNDGTASELIFAELDY